MTDDAIKAVIARNAALAKRLPMTESPALPGFAATTESTPLHDRWNLYLSIDQLAEDHTRARVSGLWMTLHSLPAAVFLVGGVEASVPDELHSRVQQYVERRFLHPVGVHYGEPVSAYYASPDRCWLADRDLSTAQAASAFAARDTVRLVEEPRRVPVAFNCVELVEEREARVQRLYAELQNGAAHGRATVDRLRVLEAAASEENELLSVDGLEALVTFANANPDMPAPEITLSASGGIMAEWRRPTHSLTLHFIDPANVQFLVKQANPRHPKLPERSSGTTTVDVVGARARALTPDSAWPIRA